MSFPRAVGAANELLRAAEEWLDALRAMQDLEPGEITRRYVDAHYNLVHRIDDYVEARDEPQQNAPRHPGTPDHGLVEADDAV